jgi:ribonuclease HI
MGIGWVQVHNEQIIHKFSAQIQLWPSSYKAELFSILSAISTCPRNSQVKIYTDSLSVILKYNKLIKKPLTLSKTLSLNLWPIWVTLLNYIKSFNITIEFHKVQAHSDNIYNNHADYLAKHHIFSSLLKFSHTNIYNPHHILQFENFSVEQSARKLIKNICNSHTIALWSSQKRMQKISYIFKYIDWNTTWLFLNNNQKQSHNFTTFQLSHQKSFRIKNLLNELPTLLHLYNLHPNIFTHNNCLSCNNQEDPQHWLFCSKNQSINTLILQTIKDFFTPTILNLSTQTTQELHNQLINHSSLQHQQPFQNYPTIETTLQGFIPSSFIDLLATFTDTHKTATKLTIQFFLKLSNNIYEQIWKPYCIKFSEWKTQNKIPNRLQQTSQLQRNPRTRYLKIDYTYSCLCGQPDQLHNNNLCPPIGLAQHKIEIWSTLWAKYSFPSNTIINIQI